MKADNPNFMVCVALREVEEKMAEARKKLEEDLPSIAMMNVRFSIQKLAHVMEELHLEAVRRTRSEAYKRGLHDSTDPDAAG